MSGFQRPPIMPASPDRAVVDLPLRGNHRSPECGILLVPTVLYSTYLSNSLQRIRLLSERRASDKRLVIRHFLPNSSGRLGRPGDIANIVALIAWPLSDYMNGANYRIDGGSTISIN